MASTMVRLLLAVAYAVAVVSAAAWALPKPLATPVLLIALGLPLALRLVPRNYLYGMRTPRTLWTTEERWYRQNVITGVAMLLTGTVWLIVVALR